MDTTRIQTRIGINAPAEDIWALIEDFPSWSRWNAFETKLSGAIAFGGSVGFDEAFEGTEARRVQMRVVEWEPMAQLVLHEKRGFMFTVLRYYEIEELAKGNCIFTNGMVFSGLRGELFHDKHRPQLRQATETIAEAMRVAAGG